MTPRIIFFGTGAPDAIRYFQTAFLIQDSTTNLLVDTGGGSGILAQIDKAGISLNDIKNIFISHKHIDHIFGIFWILRFRGATINSGKASSLKIFASKENIDLIKDISANFLKKKILELFDKKIEFIELEKNTSTNLNTWNVNFFNINSPKENQWGCKIIFPDKKTLCYIGDEQYNNSLWSICQNIDYLFHDAFCLERDREIFAPQEIHHSTVKEAAVNAKKLNVKNLILFHTEDKSTFGQRKNLYTQEAQKEFLGNIIVPEDGEIIEIK